MLRRSTAEFLQEEHEVHDEHEEPKRARKRKALAGGRLNGKKEKKKKKMAKVAKKKEESSNGKDKQHAPFHTSLAPLEPPSDVAPWLLVLGSFPSVKSLEHQQYYGFRFNHFWPVMERLFGRGGEAWAGAGEEGDPEVYARRVRRLVAAGVCVWDVIRSCQRKGSLDSAIEREAYNDIDALMCRQPSIRVVACNGGKSFSSFKKYLKLHAEVLAGREWLQRVRVVRVPSTSPAHAMKDPVVTKASKWSEALQPELGQARGGVVEQAAEAAAASHTPS